MKDEHYYTRALELSPKKAKEYYLGRADWYCIEHEYDKAYQDFINAQKLGADIEQEYWYKTCKDYIEADKNIARLTSILEKNKNNDRKLCQRAEYYLLKREYKNAISDLEQAIKINPCPYNYELMSEFLDKIKEYNVFDCVKNAKKKDLIDCLKLRLKLAQEKIALYKNVEYWRKRAELDLNKISELSKDKTLALYLRVNFFEELKDIRLFKNDNTYIKNAIHACKKVVEMSKSRTDTLGKTLTYLYEVKLVSLYSNEDEFEQAMKFALEYPEKPTSRDLKKGLEYINNFAFMYYKLQRRK